MQPKKPPRVLGPYREGAKWRVILLGPQSRRSYIMRSPVAAQALMRRLTQSLTVQTPRASMTLSAALRSYASFLQRQRSRHTVARTLRILRSFLPEPEAPLSAMSPSVAGRLARFAHPATRRLRRCYAASTRRAILGHVRRFYEWACAQGYLAVNPFAGVQPAGLIGTATRRLYRDEIPRFTATCLAAAESDDVAALGALLVGFLQLRSRQVLALRVSDVDLEGFRLRIAEGPGAGWRSVPPELRPAMARAVAQRASEELLFGPGRTGRVRPRNFLWRTVHRLCLSAKVSPTCPRALRRLTQTLHAPTPRPSRRLVLRFARSHRLHTPIVRRNRPHPPPLEDAPDASTLNERMGDLLERMQAMLASRSRRKTS